MKTANVTDALLFATVFFAPLMFFSAGSLSAFKLCVTMLVGWRLATIPLLKFEALSKTHPYWRLLLVFLVYVLFIQLMFGLWGILAYSGFPASGGSAPVGRLLTQLYSHALIITLALVLYERSRRDPALVVSAVSLALKLLLWVSVYELAAVYLGLPQIPISLAGGTADVHQNLTELLGKERFHSLAGEPRFYAVLLAVLLNVMIFDFGRSARTLKTVSKVKYIVVIGFVLLVIIYTQSTSGLIALALFLALGLAVFRDVSLAKKVKVGGIVVLVGAAFMPVLIDVVSARVINRIEEEVLSTQYLGSEMSAYVELPGLGSTSFDATDATPMVLLLEKPYLALTGVGYGNVSTYVKPYLPHYGGYWGYGYTGVVEPNLGFLKSILSYGLLGNGLLLLLFLRFMRHYNRYGRRYSRVQILSFYSLTGAFASSLTITSPMLIPIWFFAFHAAVMERDDPAAAELRAAPVPEAPGSRVDDE